VGRKGASTTLDRILNMFRIGSQFFILTSVIDLAQDLDIDDKAKRKRTKIVIAEFPQVEELMDEKGGANKYPCYIKGSGRKLVCLCNFSFMNFTCLWILEARFSCRPDL
jgi:hypothetical protein